MNVDSHIQLPNGVLKHFKGKDGKVWYLELESGEIGLSGSGKLGTEYGYFSGDMESFLNSEIESPFTMLCARIRSFSEEKCSTLTLTEDDRESVLNYVKSAMARSELCKKLFLGNSQTAFLFPDQINHDVLVRSSITDSQNIFDFLGAYEIGILINKTFRKLVVPRNCFYSVSARGIGHLVIPISPESAIILFPQNHTKNIANGKIEGQIVTVSANDVKALNIRALIYEYIYNDTFVACSDKQELCDLKFFLDEKRTDLDQMKKEMLKKL